MAGYDSGEDITPGLLMHIQEKIRQYAEGGGYGRGERQYQDRQHQHQHQHQHHQHHQQQQLGGLAGASIANQRPDPSVIRRARAVLMT